ncbi:hypothetical protein ACFFNY_09575 [Paenibacillus hodogayensis]|uniref:Group-specific protein n=1 Tax=Paenibacillus hodogayensis TaxID=279208 RepID=A0ABV5VUZ0_9BACL
MAVYVTIIILFAAISGVATILIGNSKQNKEGNPEYEKKTGGNMTRLTLIYVIAAIIGIAILIYAMN